MYPKNQLNSLLKNETEANEEEENYEQRSILGDSTTIASKDDEDSDQDELSIDFIISYLSFLKKK